MDGSRVIFIVMPIVIALVLFTGIALPFIATAVPAGNIEAGSRRARHDKATGR